MEWTSCCRSADVRVIELGRLAGIAGGGTEICPDATAAEKKHSTSSFRSIQLPSRIMNSGQIRLHIGIDGYSDERVFWGIVIDSRNVMRIKGPESRSG